MTRRDREQWDVGYVRVSTEMQIERDALQNQVQALEAYAAAHGLRLHIYKDEGISAKDTNRPELQRLLGDVQSGRVRTVLVTKLDRISRSLADLLDLMRLFEEQGAKFVSLRDSIDTSGPVGRFMLHILGAIAELERGITAERVAEDMKLRARRGKWNGGLAPYGRQVERGQLTIVPDEAELLHRMRKLLIETRTWRGVAVALNRASLRTRGWQPVERDGRIVRKGHAPEEWTAVSVKRVLLQPINAGTLVYNRRTVKGKTAVPRPIEDHVVVENFCEPIFTRPEMDDLLRVATEIEGTPPRRLVSPDLLSGLVECTCGTKMYGSHSYVVTKRGRYRVGYYRCRRASHKGTCAAKQVPAPVVEHIVVDELRRLALDPQRVAALAGEAQQTCEEALAPLLARRARTSAELERIAGRLGSLLELAEDRLVTRQEYAARRARLEAERASLEGELGRLESEIAARSATSVDVEATARGLRRLGDVFDALEEVVDRRRLLATCLSRVVVRQGAIELHVPAVPLLAGAAQGGDEPEKVSSFVHSATAGRPKNGFQDHQNRTKIPQLGSGANGKNYGIGERMDVRAASMVTPRGRACVPSRWSRAIRNGSAGRCSTASTCI
jgi:site-specific DNA recombinase